MCVYAKLRSSIALRVLITLRTLQGEILAKKVLELGGAEALAECEAAAAEAVLTAKAVDPDAEPEPEEIEPWDPPWFIERLRWLVKQEEKKLPPAEEVCTNAKKFCQLHLAKPYIDEHAPILEPEPEPYAKAPTYPITQKWALARIGVMKIVAQIKAAEELVKKAQAAKKKWEDDEKKRKEAELALKKKAKEAKLAWEEEERRKAEEARRKAEMGPEPEGKDGKKGAHMLASWVLQTSVQHHITHRWLKIGSLNYPPPSATCR